MYNITINNKNIKKQSLMGVYSVLRNHVELSEWESFKGWAELNLSIFGYFEIYGDLKYIEVRRVN